MSDGMTPSANGHGTDTAADLPFLDPETAPSRPLSVRTKSNFWDRSKILVLLIALWWLLLWSSMTKNPIEPFSDAARNQLGSLWWIEVLFGLEIIRQTHYFVSERSARWNTFWADRVFAASTGPLIASATGTASGSRG